MNRAFRRRPPFPFTNRALAINLPCAPCIKARGTHPMHYPEFFMFPGPQQVGDPGDNTLDDLIGRTYAFLWCDDFTWYVLRWVGSNDVAPGIDSVGWEVITDLLPPLPELTGNERRFSAAFDQAARLNVAYEIDGVTKVTRWDPVENQYRQNVNIVGVDPVLMFDATWAYDVPNSDVIIFYLSSDRTRVLARAQRDVYAIEYELHDYGTPVVLDRVTRLPLRSQILLSSGVGSPLTLSATRDGLLSDLYPYPHQDPLALTADLTAGEYQLAALRFDDSRVLNITSILTDGAYLPVLLRYEAGEPPVAVTAVLTDSAYTLVAKRYMHHEEIALTASLTEGAYDFTVNRYDRSPETVGVTASLEDGSYDIA